MQEIQLMIMKVIAEMNQEKFLEYNCETDEATLSVVSNGQFVVKDVMKNYHNRGDKLIELIVEEDREIYQKEFERCLKKPMNRIFDVRFFDTEGVAIWHRVFMVSAADEARRVTKVGARIVSIQKEKMAQDMLRQKAERDSMTGVYNHRTYEELSREILRKNSEGILFLMVDIDNFKEINDTKGHYVGDNVIKLVGETLQATVKDFGIAGRIGGDEFSVCLTNIWDKETATSICERIKETLYQNPEDTSFTISIGAARSNGRCCDYEQLYFEADEALYFVKENGKNQTLFYEELTRKKEQLQTEYEKVNDVSEEEFLLDQMVEYRVISDPITKKVVYINKAARDKMHLSLEDATKLPCYELLMGRCKACDVCDTQGDNVHALSDAEAVGLRKYIPNGSFILQSKYATWKGQAARMTAIMDLNNSKQVEQSFQHEMERQNAISKCWNVIHNTDTQDVDYAKVLQVLNDYYDADCSVIISKVEDEYKDIFEYHKNSAEMMIDGMRDAIKEGAFPKMEILIDKDGYMRRRYIKKKLQEHPELAAELEKKFVHNSLGIKLARQDKFVGILLIINPRHHKDDCMVLKRIGIFFATDLLRKMLSDNKEYEMSHDMLTRLWSREFFGAWQKKYGHMFKKNFGIFTADIYGLGTINKELGYDRGNERLVEVANLFRRVFGGYAIFRYDADQILAICHEIDKESFQKLIGYFKEQMQDLSVELSTGYSWTADGDFANVIREAIEYQEKDKISLSTDNNVLGKEMKKVAEDVKNQIAEGNFRVFLQPKVNISTGKTTGGEALIRLYDQKRGFVSPAFFIPILEEKGAIHLVDLFVLEEVFRFQKNALDSGETVVPISVNFSKNTLTYEPLIETLRELCENYAIPSGLIQIEITETISTMDHLLVNNIANALRNMGFSVSMDDFGTKYSNLAVLTQFDFDTVKIDRSLLLDVEKNSKNKMVLKHTLHMIQSLDMETVMEGVETAEQVEILRELGYDTVQGYFYGKPEPMEQFYKLYMTQ